MKYAMFSLLLAGLISGCASYKSSELYGDSMMGDPELNDSAQVASERMLIWTGSITLEVDSIKNAQQQITAHTKFAGGYVESSSQSNYGRPSVTLTLRIPSGKLQEVLGSLEGMGKVTSKRLSSEDITERFIDTQARLATKTKLRDRLQKLLDKAVDVKDVLAIEKELTRLQADIDSMTARLKSMKGKVDYSSLTVTLNAQKQDKVLGPLGYVWEGSKWCIKKLFVWKDESYVEDPVPESVNVISIPSTTTVSDPENHIVYPGETIQDIAKQYGVSVADIRKLNGLNADAEIREGSRLRIPVK